MLKDQLQEVGKKDSGSLRQSRKKKRRGNADRSE